jgi:hypothetical protein
VTCDVPRRLASRGFMSKISIPCIFPRISRRSRPVDCSRSVGTVPGFAPGAKRSSGPLISVHPVTSAIGPSNIVLILGRWDGRCPTYDQLSCSQPTDWEGCCPLEPSLRLGSFLGPLRSSSVRRLEFGQFVGRTIACERHTAHEGGSECALSKGAGHRPPDGGYG